jgi:hypothetical protein
MALQISIARETATQIVPDHRFCHNRFDEAL